MTIAVVTDLIFSTKITGTAKALGKTIAVARTCEKLTELLTTPETGALVIIDLNANGLDVMQAVRIAKDRGSNVVAFLSHVQADLAAAAKTAGADRVLARSAFVNELPTLLSN